MAADEAVAHGAALHASLILGRQQGQPPRFKIRNVNSHSLGVVGIDPRTQRRRNGILVPRNTPLPITSKRVFHTKTAGQRSIGVDIVEGESASAEDCSPIGHCSIRDLPADLPARSPVEIFFRYEPNGRLGVRVALPGAGREVATEIVRVGGMGKDELDRWRRPGFRPAAGGIRVIDHYGSLRAPPVTTRPVPADASYYPTFGGNGVCGLGWL